MIPFTTFRGRTAFITGGAMGLGLAMAQHLGREGMNVMLADIDAKALARAADDLRAMQIRCETVEADVTDRGSVRAAALRTIEAFGKVHLVVNNAGVGAGGAMGTVAERDWDWVIDVNLKGVVYGTETFVPLIRSHGEGGHVINTASMAGMLGVPQMEPYCATKFAVVAMSEGWALQLMGEGIGVSVLCPGFVKTRIHESGRNRHAKYGGASDRAGDLGSHQAAAAVLSGIDPEVIGARVVEALKAGELYIFTHPEMKPFVEHRFAGILAAFDKAAASPVIRASGPHAPVTLMPQGQG